MSLSKAEVVKYLEERDLDSLCSLAREGKRVATYIIRCLYSVDELLRKRAIEALGFVCVELAQKDPEIVLNILRQLLWSVTEESGGIGWSASEAMAEIVKRLPEQFSNYGTIAVSLLDEEPLQKGGLWAAGTLAEINPAFVTRVIPQITKFLDHPDPVLRAYAARALVIANPKEEKLRKLENDFIPVQIYQDGQLLCKSVAELAGHRPGA